MVMNLLRSTCINRLRYLYACSKLSNDNNLPEFASLYAISIFIAIKKPIVLFCLSIASNILTIKEDTQT